MFHPEMHRPVARKFLQAAALGALLIWAGATHAQTTAAPPAVPIQTKLARIVLPNIEFRQTTLSDALEFLRQESRRLDTDPDPAARGINLILKLPATPAPAAAPAPAADPGACTMTLQPAGAKPGNVPTANTRITLTMNRLPLAEVLKYVANQAGLKVKVEPYAVSLVPPSENTDQMVTATFRVSPSLLGNKTSHGSQNSDYHPID